MVAHCARPSSLQCCSTLKSHSHSPQLMRLGPPPAHPEISRSLRTDGFQVTRTLLPLIDGHQHCLSSLLVYLRHRQNFIRTFPQHQLESFFVSLHPPVTHCLCSSSTWTRLRNCENHGSNLASRRLAGAASWVHYLVTLGFSERTLRLSWEHRL